MYATAYTAPATAGPRADERREPLASKYALEATMALNRKRAGANVTQALSPIIDRVNGTGSLVLSAAKELQHKIDKASGHGHYRRWPDARDAVTLCQSGSLVRAIEDLETARNSCDAIIAELRKLQETDSESSI